MVPAKGKALDKVVPIEDYEHSEAKRTNNPPAGLAHLDREETPLKALSYDPHLDPQLVWAGKAERTDIEVAAPSVHVHEELSAQNIIGSVRRQRLQQPLFDVDRLDADEAVEFYQHDLGWSNRMILGDSLMVMSSLLERERLAGQVQCIYIDPPYGIKYNSNFQPSVRSRDVKHGKEGHLTREPEMIQAYRDTWELGVHSYLTYLRDRLEVSRDLLTTSGSLFVQISDENLHYVRAVLDEVFGSGNFVSMISFVTTSGFAQAKGLARAGDYLLWYARSKADMKVRPLWLESKDRQGYSWLRMPDGSQRGMTAAEKRGDDPIPEEARIYKPDNITSQGAAADPQPFEYEGKTYLPPRNAHWKASYPAGMERLVKADRIHVARNSIQYVRYQDDFGYQPLTNLWTDTGTGNFTEAKRYVVQTNTKVIERCVQMTTDPGDLVLDPTSGSGTTAVACENLGRRWIMVDTSRVALAIARERLLTFRFPYFELLDPDRGVDAGFKYRTASRTTLGSIANDESSEEVVLVDQPLVDAKTTRVTGPFTVEALSRYSHNPAQADGSARADTAGHVEALLEDLRTQGVPRPGSKPLEIESLIELSTSSPLQAEGVVQLDGQPARFAVSLGPRFGAITMAQVSDALRHAIGFDMVVFAGFAVSADAQEKLGKGTIGSTGVALLMANPDVLLGDLLKTTTTSQTFRLYVSPDVEIDESDDGFRLTVAGVDSFDAATGEVVSLGRAGIQAWFLDDDFDDTVFRVSQAFFPISDAWKKLQRALRGTIDAELLEEMHGWTSLPFDRNQHGKVAVRVIADDGNASELIIDLPEAAV